MGRALEEEEMSLLGSRDEIFLEAVRVREEEMLLCLRQMPYNIHSTPASNRLCQIGKAGSLEN